jgi:hypothetical protein
MVQIHALLNESRKSFFAYIQNRSSIFLISVIHVMNNCVLNQFINLDGLVWWLYLLVLFVLLMSNVFDSNLEQIHLTLCVYLRQGGVIVFVALICVTFSGLKYK